MPNVFEYTDFRKYLADHYHERKKEDPEFSYQAFASKAGFKNKGFIFNIIKGKKKLSNSNIQKLSSALGLADSRHQAGYFEILVRLNQSTEFEVRKHLYERLESIKNQGKKTSSIQTIRKDQYEFYSKWYHSAIRSLINNYEFKNDYKWLARNVYPRITPLQAKKSVELLKRLGLIEEQPDGNYGVTNKLITTGQEVTSLAVANLHLETLGLAAKSIKDLPRNKRNVTGLTLGISQKTYDLICAKTQQFQSEILEIAKNDPEADRVYQYDFAFFPLSKTEIKGRKKCRNS